MNIEQQIPNSGRSNDMKRNQDPFIWLLLVLTCKTISSLQPEVKPKMLARLSSSGLTSNC